MKSVMDRDYFDKGLYPNCWAGHNYALDVVEENIVSCKYVFGACQRFLNDLQEGKYPFVADKAEKYLRIVQKFPHVKGKWKTPNIQYEPWQCFFKMQIYGFINPLTGYRRFRVAHLEVPRGNAKSAMCSQAGLYELAVDEPNGNEISCFATKTDQARIVLDVARNMAKKSPNYLSTFGVKVLAHKISQEESNSVMRAMSAEDKSLDGLNDILAIMDELHVMTRELFDVVTSGMSKRQDSLVLCITTAGFNTDSVGHSQSVYAKKVACGEYLDDTFLALVYTIDDGDDIYDEKTWKKANPNWGVSVDPVTFAAKALKAKETPSDLPNLKVKHLNIWLSEAQAFYDLPKWDRCFDPTLKIEDFLGKRCYAAADLSSKVDLTALGYVFEEIREINGKKEKCYAIFDRSFIPQDKVKELRNTLFDDCVSKGFLTATVGEAIHYPFIHDQVVADAKKFKIIDFHYDPWNAIKFAQDLSKERINMVEFRFTTANLSEPTKSLDAFIRQGKIRHNGSPLLRWALGNVVCKEDAGGNVFPRKTHERLKIDPVIAIIMALAGWLQNESNESVYESRGLLSV